MEKFNEKIEEAKKLYESSDLFQVYFHDNHKFIQYDLDDFYRKEIP